MSTQMIGAGRRLRKSAVLVALALVVAVFLLATQASSIWSTSSQVQRVPAHVTSPLPQPVLSLPALVRPGPNRGQVRFGPLPARQAPTPRPHGPNQRPKWGS